MVRRQLTARVLVLALTGLLPAAATATALAIAAREQLAPEVSTLAPRNMAEAAGMDMPSEVIRRLRLGEDPIRIYQLRPEIISSSVQYATVGEAALWSRHLEMIRMLDENGVIVGDEPRRHLACLAADLGGVAEIVEYLSKADDPPCVPGAAMAAVQKRTTGG